MLGSISRSILGYNSRCCLSCKLAFTLSLILLELLGCSVSSLSFFLELALQYPFSTLWLALVLELIGRGFDFLCADVLYF